MTDKEQKKAAKEFAAYWKDKGSEKSDTQTYWNQLLTDVFGAEKLTGLELSRNVQSENTQNLGWADIMQRDERAVWKFLVPQVGDRLH